MHVTTPIPALSQQTLIHRTAGSALLTLFVAMTWTVNATEVRGTVVAVADGDTLTVLDADRVTHKLRIDAIDAPERSQPYGERARQSLAGLAHGRSALAHCPKTDRYGRAVCRVTVDGVDVGLEQIRRGLAWHYARYAHEQSPLSRAAYAGAETDARSGRAGLWSTGEPTAPWEYRRSRRGQARG